MRIALATSSARLVGGAESYIQAVVPLLQRAGHEIALLYEFDGPTERARIDLGLNCPTWNIAETGRDDALDSLARWRPGLVYSQSVNDPILESRIPSVASSVIFVHAYHGSCIGGGKTFKRPVPIACDRAFGPLCLAHYYPHRCGGLNPLIMWRDYRNQAARLEALRSYRIILTASEHMRTEYLKYGFSAEAVRRVHYPVIDDIDAFESPLVFFDSSSLATTGKGLLPSRITFLGRMEYLKGGSLLIDAVPEAVAALNRRLTITFAGDGRERAALERRARGAQARDPRLDFLFVGWLDRNAVRDLLDHSDLLAVPSIWPEPFGLAGPEAGLHGVPAVAFQVGGIPEWLIDGVNGYLAPGDPPTSMRLAAAIEKCLSDPSKHARLSSNAREVALRFSMNAHMGELSAILQEAAER